MLVIPYWEEETENIKVQRSLMVKNSQQMQLDASEYTIG